MSAHTSVTINCDGDDLPGGRAEQPDDDQACWWWTEGDGSRTVSSVRRYAHIEGWRRRRVNDRLLDLCPACVRKVTR